jgi:hypothetical protein
MNIKDKVILNLKNLPGKRFDRKYIIIECDDWGSIRMPSKEVYNKLLKAHIPVDQSRFNRFDTLADKEDLDYLFEVLLSVKDRNGRPAVMTPFTNIANPDFSKIRDTHFSQYFCEPFTKTLIKYGRHKETFITWQKGFKLGIFIPEFHGREHISVTFWLQKLREGERKLMYAFDNEFVSVPSDGLHWALQEFRSEFYFNNTNQIDFLKNSLTDGVKLFEEVFDYIPYAFVPANGIFHPCFESTLASTGVKYLNVNHFNPVPDMKGNIKLKYYRTGKRTADGLTFYNRNSAFEPTDPLYCGIDLTLKQIEAAFRWGKPANISTHRVNFVGGIKKSNRDKGIKELKLLLDEIVKIWPDIEFTTTRELYSNQRSFVCSNSYSKITP